LKIKKQKKKKNKKTKIELVNALYQIPMPKKLAKDPKMRPQKLDNIEQALSMLTNEAHVKTNFLKVKQ